MVKTKLYIARHGKTMFNTIGRAQGWSDSPLTVDGERGIQELGLGLKDAGIVFKEAFSSDSGRTLQTMEIILRECQQENIPYTRDKRIREWCFGSLDGGYDGELFNGVLPRVFDKDMTKLTYQEMAAGIYQVDTAGWAETWEVLSGRILEGFTAIAEKIEALGGGNAIVVSHGMTIGTFLWLVDRATPRSLGLDNGSISVVSFENGKFTIESIGDVFIVGIFVFVQGDKLSLSGNAQKSSTDSSSLVSSESSTSSTASATDLPDVSSSDWELVLVNRDNITAEMNPDLTQIDNIYVDSRITDNVRNFLAAAQAIDSSEHLISGYRSVAYQEELFNSYVSQEMATNPSLTQEAAEDLVKTYSQPAGASEHQTGLAIDMSTVNSLNESDADVVAQVVAIAPEYGFVLRFPEGKSDSTGVDYEDWHFRYVGVESAKYMTENNLTLEEYVSLLKENNR